MTQPWPSGRLTSLASLRSLPGHTGMSFRGIDPESGSSDPPTRASVGLVPTSLDLRIATENFATVRYYAIIGSGARNTEEVSPHPHERERLYLPPSRFDVIGAVDHDRASAVVVQQVGSPAWEPWVKIRSLIERHLELAWNRPAVEIASPGRFVGDLSGRDLPLLRPSFLQNGATVRVGSHEHYGWTEQTWTIQGLHPGPYAVHEFLQVSADEGSRQMFLRRRFDDPDWTTTAPGETQVASWLGPALPDGEPFEPARRNPTSWLYVKVRSS
ncbi:hypothetical protein [Aeromicrobium chenweiae]|uniref:Uncharacterized protein n=1 Tax=Aeromicrobium chenweiae TaxID=2079793 RepID=A0A2S0WQK2_9ACTN|nr:hypothetical protein [Aeromicrobium chenweiae]AWB93601.1 hypothetical protein C3E78_16060 [Aeromicrobium chenweiae]TGN33251.1 hypothetical protein E4L97_06075 [Aeromicrobium chenweiae]